MWLLGVIAIIFVFCGSLYAAELPQSAQKILNQLPGQKLSLELVLALGVRNTDAFKLISSEAITKDNARLAIEQALDSKISALISRTDNRNEVTSAFSPSRTQASKSELTYTNNFATGTSVSVGLETQQTELDLAPIVVANGGLEEYSEGFTTLSVRQSLWKNAFGQSTREALRAAGKQSESVLLSIEDQVDEFTVELVGLYYDAWLAQARVYADEDKLKRQRRLLNITKLQQSRGNAEEADVLQLEAALEMTRQSLEDSKKNLGDVWRQLVATLKMPKHLYQVNPRDIPMTIDSAFESAEQLCSGPESAQKRVADSAPLLQARVLYEAAQLNFKSRKRDLNPDLYLMFSTNSNGIEDEPGPALDESISGRYPATTLGLGIEIPLDNSSAKREAADAFKNKIQSQTRLSQVQSELEVSWMNSCRGLRRAASKVTALERVFQRQLRRSRLEERRFSLGRITAFNVISAGNDVTDAEMLLKQAEASLRQAGWQVLRLNGQIKSRLSKLEDQKYQVEW